jgi:metal-sulfur cluster biosynthetic enzyme
MKIEVPAPEIHTLHEAFKTVFDPEFGVSIEDLGLIHDIRIETGVVFVQMTLTSMYCPAGDVIVNGVQAAAQAVAGVVRAEVELVWDPLWTPDRLTPEARRLLGWDLSRVNA